MYSVLSSEICADAAVMALAHNSVVEHSVPIIPQYSNALKLLNRFNLSVRFFIYLYTDNLCCFFRQISTEVTQSLIGEVKRWSLCVLGFLMKKKERRNNTKLMKEEGNEQSILCQRDPEISGFSKDGT